MWIITDRDGEVVTAGLHDATAWDDLVEQVDPDGDCEGDEGLIRQAAEMDGLTLHTGVAPEDLPMGAWAPLVWETCRDGGTWRERGLSMQIRGLSLVNETSLILATVTISAPGRAARVETTVDDWQSVRDLVDEVAEQVAQDAAEAADREAEAAEITAQKRRREASNLAARLTTPPRRRGRPQVGDRQITVILPDDVRGVLAAAAADHGRSLSAEIRHRLTVSVGLAQGEAQR